MCFCSYDKENRERAWIDFTIYIGSPLTNLSSGSCTVAHDDKYVYIYVQYTYICSEYLSDGEKEKVK